MRALKGAGFIIVGIVVVVALSFLAAASIFGLVWVSKNVLNYLNIAATVAFAACVFVLLPLALLRSTRKFSVYGFFISSAVFGAGTWVLSFLVTFQYWGVIGLFVGVIMGVIGVVPLGMLASAFNGDWSQVGNLALGLVLTFGARAIAILLAHRMDRDEAAKISPPEDTGRGVRLPYAKEKSLVRFDRIQNMQMMMTAVYVVIVGGLAIRGIFDPTRYDYQQAMVNFQYHPIASIAGALFPTVLFAPLAYWMSGRIFRRNAARFKTCEHCAETIKAAAKVCRYCGRDVAPVGQVEVTTTPQQGEAEHRPETDAITFEPSPATLATGVVSATVQAQSRNLRQPRVALVIACTFGLVVYLGLNFNPLRHRFAGQEFDPAKFLEEYSTQQKTEWPGTEHGPSEEHQGTDAYNRGDYVTALRLFRPLADQGNALAQFNVGWMYANGRGVPKNDAEAVRWYRLAANQGRPSAQYNLGVAYASGEGVPKNDAEAVKWYRLAALQGYNHAQYNLGVAYASGEGVPKNDAEAVKWFHLAANQGYNRAQVDIGTMYFNGRGVLQNDTEAVKWFRKAADQGDAYAQHNLGVMYSEGRGVPQNYTLAHMWFNLAAMRGNQDAIKRRDLTAQLMTAAQITEAQKLARAWKTGSER